MNTPIKLEEYFFPVVQVVADPSAEEEDQGFKYKAEVSLSHNEEEDLYQVAVEISSIPEGKDQKQHYTINLVVIGLFRVASDFPNIGKLLYVNGSSILYGAAREFLITITSRGPWEALRLPTHSFLEQYESEAGKDEETKKQKSSKGGKSGKQKGSGSNKKSKPVPKGTASPKKKTN